jgi:hypothetical protein
VRNFPPVRQSLFLSLLGLALGISTPSPSRAELLPEIEANVSRITPLEVSHSKRVYRFKIKSGEAPRTGSIILVQHQGRPLMAFRVLRSDADVSEFIGKRVRRYDTEGELKLEEEYVSAEKVANLVVPPPIENRFDPNAKPELDPIGGTDLHPPSKETELKLDPNAPPLLGDGGPIQGVRPPESQGVGGNLEQFDQDLDSGTSPRNLKRNGDEEDEGRPVDEDGEMNRSPSEVEEAKIFNPFKNMIGVSIGNYRNLSSFSIPGTTHNGFSVWYNRVIERGVWIYNRKTQDSLALEFGVTHYSRVNFTGNNDGYDLLPFKAEVVYALHTGERLAFLVHGGLQYNWIYSTDNVNPSAFPNQRTALNILSGIQPNAGVGALLHIGPQWYLRADAGLDRIAFGLAVKW